MTKRLDWVHWRRMEELSLGDAICLLLKIDPGDRFGKQVSRRSSSYDFSTSQRELYAKAGDIWDVAWSSYHQCTLRMIAGLGGTSVSMKDWLAWARAKNYDIPDELADLVPVHSSEGAHDASVYAGGVTWVDAAYDKRLARAGRQETDDGEASTSSETRRLSTLQRLVLAMAKAKYRWEPGEKNAATGTKAGSIYADVIEQLGEGRRIDADTIRRVLQQAADDFPGVE